MTSDGVRVAGWSGPRNISTALMRSWGSRPDTVVCDEPLYAHYLASTGIAHPMAAEVIDAHDTDWQRVVAWLTGPVPEGRAIFYQKHMAQHLLAHIPMDWIAGLRNFLLIRDPAEVLASFSQVYAEPSATDTGLPQQARLFDWLCEQLGEPPPVVDARDVLIDPRGVLTSLCSRLGVPFDEAMLSWPPGPRPTDGVWAPAWYGSVLESTGFLPYRPRRRQLESALQRVADECRPLYERLHAHRLPPVS
jgi:hypothetical protein